MNLEITKPDFKFSFQWLVDLITRIINDVFGFLAKEEGWTEAE